VTGRFNPDLGAPLLLQSGSVSMGSKQSGRPKYTAELHAKLVGYLEAGAFKKHAANAVGIAARTLEAWLKRGDDGEEPYAQLALDVEKAIATDAIRNQTIISKAAAGEHAGDWKAAAWNLERKFPKLYGHMATGHELPVSDKPYSPWKHAQSLDDSESTN
jgi:hypothetical protein